MIDLYNELKKERDEWFRLAVERGSALSILVHTIKFHEKFGEELDTLIGYTDEIIKDSEQLGIKFNVNFGGKSDCKTE